MSDPAMRRADFMMVLAYASDLATGHSLDFALRSCVLGMRLADLAGFDAQGRRNVYHQALLRYAGCNADSYLMAAALGDEIALRKELAGLDMGDKSKVGQVFINAFKRLYADLDPAEQQRAIQEGLGGALDAWQDMLVVLAALSMVVGNVVAIAQTNIKRMLAYSTISHVGFILLGVLAGSAAGYRAAMFYTLTYVIMTTGAFGVVLWLSRKGFEADALDDYKGLNRRHPWFAFIMLLVVFGLAGVPPTVGFWAKLQVISAVLDVDITWLAALAVLGAWIGRRVAQTHEPIHRLLDPPPGLVALCHAGFIPQPNRPYSRRSC